MSRPAVARWEQARGRLEDPRGAPNPGLVFERWLPVWDEAALGRGDAIREEGIPALRAFAARFATLAPPLRDALADHHRRMDAVVTGAGGWSEELSLVSPLALGLGASHPTENSFSFDPTLGVPWIPGSAIKGVARRWAELNEWAPERITAIFGPEEGSEEAGSGGVTFFGAWPAAEPPLLDVEIVNCHLPGWYARMAAAKPAARPGIPGPLQVENPVPVYLLAVPPGTRFTFRLRSGDPALTAAAMGLLRDALYWLGVGGKTAAGFGSFRAKNTAVEVPRGPRPALLHMDVDAPERPEGAPEGAEVLRYSERGPRSVWSGGVRSAMDWVGGDRAIGALVDELRGRDQQPELWVTGKMPLPLAFSLGMRLGSWRRVRLLAEDPSLRAYAVDPSEGEADWLQPATWSAETSSRRGWVVLHVSATGRPIDADALGPVTDGVPVLAVASTAGTGALTAAHGRSTQEGLRERFREVGRRFPNAEGVIVTLEGPWPLAVMAGRAINPNVVRQVRVPNFARGRYEQAFVYPAKGEGSAG